MALKTHDIALPIRTTQNQQLPDYFMLLVLSVSDLKSEAAVLARVERLHLQGGGKHVGIIFLLQEKNDENSRNGTIELMNLQLRYVFEPCPLPVTS